MSAARQRKAQGTRVALDLKAKYRALAEAQGEEAIQHASIQLGLLFNDNIEFIINALREWSGLTPEWDRPMTRPAGSAPPPAANDLPKVPELLRAGADVDLPRKPH